MHRTRIAAMTALATAALLLPAHRAEAWPASVPRYTRCPAWATIPDDVTDTFCVASRIVPEASEMNRWLIAREIGLINEGVSGNRLRVPVYRRYTGPQSCYATADLRTWHVCVLAGMRYRVRPSTLVGIRLHEGGNTPTPKSYFGCKPYGAYSLRSEAMMCASILARVCQANGWCGWHLSRGQLEQVGYHYTTGKWGGRAEDWAACVQIISRRAEGR